VRVEVAVAGDGEGDWALRTEPRMDSGIWKKEALLAGEAARGGEAWRLWCFEAASAAIVSSSSISPATVYGQSMLWRPSVQNKDMEMGRAAAHGTPIVFITAGTQGLCAEVWRRCGAPLIKRSLVPNQGTQMQLLSIAGMREWG